jgi:SsrA-binding protein
MCTPSSHTWLLMHRREIDRLNHTLAVEHLALVPLSIYFKEGLVKVELGLARGRKKADKRQAMAERDTKMEIAKAMGRQAKGKNP